MRSWAGVSSSGLWTHVVGSHSFPRDDSGSDGSARAARLGRYHVSCRSQTARKEGSQHAETWACGLAPLALQRLTWATRKGGWCVKADAAQGGAGSREDRTRAPRGPRASQGLGLLPVWCHAEALLGAGPDASVGVQGFPWAWLAEKLFIWTE